MLCVKLQVIEVVELKFDIHFKKISLEIKKSYLKVLKGNSFSAIGIVDILVALSSRSWWCMWWYPHMVNSTTKCDWIWNCLSLIHSLIQITICSMMVCLSLHGLLCGTGMYVEVQEGCISIIVNLQEKTTIALC